MPDGDAPSRTHPWFAKATLAAALAVRRTALAQPSAGGSRAVREVILAHHPALPLTMISEAMAFVIGSE